MKSPPTLVWAPAKGATYYNLQLIRGRKVLSAWPVRPSFRLRRTWLYNGRRYRLEPGVYRWYVWPGYGRISPPLRQPSARKQHVRRDEVGRRVRRHAAALLFAVAALLLTPGAAGLPNVPGDPTPPVVTPVITGTLGSTAGTRPTSPSTGR